MANATLINVRQLVLNGELANPTADVLDTGTAAVTLPLTPARGRLGRVILRVVNTAAAGLVVTVNAGDDPPAGLSGKGAFAATSLAQNAIAYLGPFESGQFGQNDGTMSVTFTPASGTITCNVTALQLPRGA